MSTIMKKPLIETIMDNLDGDTLVKLHSDIDSDTGYSEYNLLERYLPQLGEGETSLAVRATLITNGETLVGSYIKYSSLGETHSYLLNYGRGVHKVYIYEINEEKRTTYLVGECLGVSELRRVIVDRLIEQGANDIPIHKNENGSYVFNDGLEVKSNGDVTVGKNLEVDGTTKLNGGLTPIATYNADITQNGHVVSIIMHDYGEIKNIQDSTKRHLLSLYRSDNGVFIYGLGFYSLSGQKLQVARIVGYGPEFGEAINVNLIVPANQLTEYTYATTNSVNNKQDRLYIHTLTLTASDKTYILAYDSSSNLNADSVADLRTIMKISSSHDSEVLPLCSSDMTSTACLKVTASVCQIGTNNVTAVADVVDLK